MGMKEISLEWQAAMHFSGYSSGNNLQLDSEADFGGHNKGFRPKELILFGLAGCTGMDVISILSKMRSLPEKMSIHVTAKETEKHPKIFQSINVIYNVTGSTPKDKLIKAVQLSQEKYCGIAAMLGKSSTLTYEIIYNQNKL